MLSRIARASERGQMLIAIALLAPVLLAMTGMAVDIGKYADDKRHLQNAADAIALAAAQELCTPNLADCSNPTNATTTAQAYAAKNGIPWSQVTLSFENLAVTPTGNPTARVAIAHDHRFSFMSVVGIDSKGIGAKAGAIKTSPGGMAGLTPFGVTELPTPGTTISLVFDAGGGCQSLSAGNCGAMQYDPVSGGSPQCNGSGGSLYRCTIKQGGQSTVCAKNVTTCTNTSQICATYDTCPAQTGISLQNTKDGVNFLLDNTSGAGNANGVLTPDCDTFAKAFSGPDANGVYAMNNDCNPFVGPGACPHPDDLSNPAQCSRRVIIIPLVDGFPNGNSYQPTILGFGLFWLDGFAGGACSGGSSCTVQATYVKSDLTVNALAGIFDATTSIHFTKLTE